ncbi:hypothetical protein C0J52_03479 [Blattella germanica]|nr:hypothetical protein C0J52_03479 [Blattella germanica]
MVSAERDGRCPNLKEWGVCPVPAHKCIQDDDCPGNLDKCCSTACNKEGDFESIQCDAASPNCWCVDAAGYEIPGTRAPARGLVNCSNPKPCGAHTCRMLCPHGFSIDPDGCPRCQCYDPCSKRARSLENVCPAGEPLKITNTERPFLCGISPGKPRCPPLFECQVERGNDYGVCCPASFKLQKPGSCPAPNSVDECGLRCEHDLECPSMQKCCACGESGQFCTQPQNVTVCLQQRMLAELLIMNEREGKGYVPQCSPSTGQFESRQCSRNGLICWCVDSQGNKLPRSMGPADTCVNMDLKLMKMAVLHVNVMTHAWGSLAAQASNVLLSETKIVPASCATCTHMCEYLRDFSDKMEGTREGMTLALHPPKCHPNGSYVATQCHDGECWCVDSFGSEIPDTRTRGPTACEALREELGCLDLTCRLGCDYGFQLDPDTRCPLCECRNPCDSVTCGASESCQMVEVNCEGEYCPPPGQCPYLIPVGTATCDYECRTDLNCNGTDKCCSNGCGTQCLAPVMLTACQHKRAILEHKAHESGIPARQMYLPQCRESDGSFEPVQCHPISRQCWCVDKKGDELPGTRAPPDVQPSCMGETSRDCPLLKCIPCPYGYKLDASGCSTCDCKDPCAEISCFEEGEACRLVDVTCTDQPCPPVPMCLPRRENPCQTGHPLLMPGSTDMVQCGPNGSPCPSSHKCHLSPLGEYAVCCPKPRDVCFEPIDVGPCDGDELRWYFDSQNNTCTQFTFGGCAGNQNNFDSEETCHAVCPVLSQCERMREKNQRVAEKYKSTTFIPRCDPETGDWESVQCLEQVGVCWCVNRVGEPIKGSITRDTAPKCNSRQARRRMNQDPDFAIEELLKEVAMLTDEVPRKTRCQALQERMYAVNCDSDGKFLPTQCYPRKFPECWCVDEAGNQLPNTTTFKRVPTPIEAVEVRLGFLGQHKETTNDKLIGEVRKILERLGAKLRNNLMEAETHPEATYVMFEVIGNNKVDVAFHLEEMVRSHKLNVGVDGLMADITSSRFSHRLSDDTINEVDMSDRVIALEHREIVSQSTVSVVTPYQTAIIVLSVASAFIICILVVVIILYRKKVSSEAANASKTTGLGQNFLSQTSPIYVVSLPQNSSFPRTGIETEKEQI